MNAEKAVFISHASKNADVATSLCKLLEKQSVSCWIAPRDIPSGTSYGDEIVRGIENCAVVVLVLTGHSNQSRAVANELELAFAKGKVIVPVRLEDIKPSTALQFFVSNAQWIDAVLTPLRQRVPTIVEVVRAVQSGSPIPSVQPERPSLLGWLELLAEDLFRRKVLLASLILCSLFVPTFYMYSKDAKSEAGVSRGLPFQVQTATPEQAAAYRKREADFQKLADLSSKPLIAAPSDESEAWICREPDEEFLARMTDAQRRKYIEDVRTHPESHDECQRDGPQFDAPWICEPPDDALLAGMSAADAKAYLRDVENHPERHAGKECRR